MRHSREIRAGANTGLIGKKSRRLKRTLETTTLSLSRSIKSAYASKIRWRCDSPFWI